ncbi:MAG: hypothetical protein K9N48_05495 [Verrucomicrobia bacterium]|nr:hypothetical protein [Verrucomicrobiota bacterium]MCF7708320.1 hypothetical protein [Verrucomicrobiota bacterium]
MNPFNNRDFLFRLGDYYSENAAIRATNASGESGRKIMPGEIHDGEFYCMNTEAMVAMSHVIEDISLDTAKGSLTVIFQDFDNFIPHREEYWQLAETLDEVRVLGGGRKPRKPDKVRFIKISDTSLIQFWIVLFHTEGNGVLLMSKQNNNACDPENKRFCGFYSFNPSIISRAKQELDDILDGRAERLNEYYRLKALHKAGRRLSDKFEEERAKLSKAIQKTRNDFQSFPLDSLDDELDKSIKRLTKFKTRLINETYDFYQNAL